MRNRGSRGWQTKQFSFGVSLTLSINGVQNMAHGAIVMGFDSLLGVASVAGATPIWKTIQIAGFDYTSDYGFQQVSNLQTNNVTLNGAECWYIDSIGTNGIGRLEAAAGVNAQTFLALNEIGGVADAPSFPRRTVYRRRFSVSCNNGSNTNVLSAVGFANAGALTPGFNTNRQIRRRIRLGRQEALFVHWEVYGIQTTAASNIIFAGDYLGAITYRVVA